MSANQPQVFISYQRVDEAFARQVREHLAANGVATWMDQFDIPVGAYWPDEIDKGLAASDIVVGVLSPDSVESRNVKNEWDWAIANDKRLLLLMVRPCVIPHRYISINYIDATDPEPATALAALLDTLGVTALDTTVPETGYARSGDVSIAYQVLGDGPIDLVVSPGFASHLELNWEEPRLASYLRRLASFSRMIHFDKRGTGLSDRVSVIPPLDVRVDDIRAVMDAAGSERAVVMGVSEGGPMSALFATTYPERTIGLILYGTFAATLRSDDYPWGSTPDEYERDLEAVLRNWGADSITLDHFAPSVADDDQFRAWFMRYVRFSASPGAAAALHQMNASIDIRHVLPSIDVPTLVLHRTGDRDTPVGAGHYLAEHIPGARFVELPGIDHLPWVGDADSILSEIEAFVSSFS
jgi:pimeloyl-ACP methyl ester carboxylesterase